MSSAQLPRINTLSQKEFAQLAFKLGADKSAGYFNNGDKSWAELESRYRNFIPGKVIAKTHIRKAAEVAGIELNIRRAHGPATLVSTSFRRLNSVATVVKRMADSLQVDSSEINWDLSNQAVEPPPQG
jgi:hypothetical protein